MSSSPRLQLDCDRPQERVTGSGQPDLRQKAKQGMFDAKHRLIVLNCATIAAATALAVFVYLGWVETERFKPSYDIVLELNAPRQIGCFAAYTNEDYNAPAVACLSHDG